MATNPQLTERVDPLLVSGAIGASGKDFRQPITHTPPLIEVGYRDYFLTHLSQVELSSLGKIGEINPLIVSGLYRVINNARAEGVSLMPWVTKILREYDSVQLKNPDYQDEYIIQYHNLALELLNFLCDIDNNRVTATELEQSKNFVIHSLGAFHRTFAELSFLSGDQEPLLNLRSDPLYHEDFLDETPLQFTRDESNYPQAVIAHNTIAISQVIHGLFLQVESGVNPVDLEAELKRYYDSFKFDEITTNNYTEHDTLLSVGYLELSHFYENNPLPQGATICVAGCGREPIELKIFAKLKAAGKLPSDCVIEMFDMQSAESLGVNYSNPEDNNLSREGAKLGLNVRFYPGYKLADWVEKNTEKYHTVTLIGSVLNNDPNQLHWLSDFVALKRLLKPGEGSSLVVDTANLETLAEQNPHYQAWIKYRQEHPTAPVGSRHSAHMDAYAQIFPSYYFRAINTLLSLKHSKPVVWDANGKYRSLWIEENTSKEISTLAKTVLKLMTTAYAKNVLESNP